MEDIIKDKQGPTLRRWSVAIRDKAFALIRNRVVIETLPDEILLVLRTGKVSTNVYMQLEALLESGKSGVTLKCLERCSVQPRAVVEGRESSHWWHFLIALMSALLTIWMWLFCFGMLKRWDSLETHAVARKTLS
jgi:hypothetical protein